MLDKSTCIKFYKRKDIQEAIIEHAVGKEIGMRFNTSFGKRPDVLTYPRDVLELALQGITSFHASEERWENPLQLSGSTTKKELDELRTGWDLVLDIDCAIMEYSRICADLIIKFLEYCGVKDISCKFSGNKGFHIGVPFEAFPSTVRGEETRLLFPDAAKKIAFYIKENIEEELGKRILDFEGGSFGKIVEKVKLPQEEITGYTENSMGDKIARLNPDKFLEIDTVLISSRHLYRMPYSLHEKSGLVSLPIDPKRVLEFEKHMAEPSKVLMPMFRFLDRNASGESARRLLLQALDYEVKQKGDEKEEREYEEIKLENPIQEDFFPPCMKLLSQGIEDGKKRSVFCMMNYLGKIGWSKPEVDKYLHDWNKKNPEQLREVYIKGQLNHFKPGEKLPPNCNNEAYYKDLGVCKPDKLCGMIKNPVNYTLLRWKRWLRDKEEGRIELTEEEKAKKKEEKKKESNLKKKEKQELPEESSEEKHL